MKTLSVPPFQHCSSAVAASSFRKAFIYSNNNKKSNIQSFIISFPYSRLISSSYRCSATTLPTMAAEEKQRFDADDAAVLVMELQKSFNLGKTTNYEWRMSQIQNIANMIEQKEKDIMEAIYMDLSKPRHETFVSEISMTRNACKLALKELKSWMKPDKAKTPLTMYPSSAEIVSEPLGVVLVISTWNYPFLLSLDPVIGAIAAGNAVVLKPSEIAPATSSLLAKLLEEYVDKSAVRVVEGAVAETSALLEQKWDKIFYTGSPRVGRIVMAAAAKHLTPVTLELGGKCPAVVDSNINLQVAARRIIAGKWTSTNGQACIGVDYIITTKDFASKLIDTLRNVLEEFFGKSPMESKDLSRIVNLFHFRRLASLLDEDRVSDKIVYGGQIDESQLKIAPTILLDVPEDSMIINEEIFGPLLPIVTVKTIEDSFTVIKSKAKPLAAYLFTDDEQLKKNFVQNISAGAIVFNDTIVHTVVSSLPFGGVGESGMGSYHGKFSFDTFSHKKAVLYRSFEGDSAARYPPYTPEKLRLLRALLTGNIFDIILALIGWSRD